MSPELTERIAFFLPNLHAGGAQSVTITIANSLANSNQDVDLVVAGSDGQLVSAVDSDVRLVNLDSTGIPYIGIGACVPRLGQYLASVRPSVVFSGQTYANIVAITASGLTASDAVIVPTEHSVFPNLKSTKDRVTATIAKQLYRQVPVVLCVSQAAEKSVIRNTSLQPSDTEVIHNPVDVQSVRERGEASVDHQWFEEPDCNVVLGTGRLEPEKDFNTLLHAFATVHDDRPDTRLVVLGEGSQADELTALADSLGVREHVSFPGYVENPYSYMARASVFALSSRREGLPTVLIEALACGCTVVATDAPGGTSEVLSDGEHGCLVPVGDEAAFAEAVQTTLDTAPKAARLRARSRDFQPNHIISEYSDLARRLTQVTE